ncbi:MAG TPA: hypothetical protein VF666_09555 [Pyrinomonadaceae bacterium]|jgi:hypothetical protein
MKSLLILTGIALASLGGVVAYRAAFLEPKVAVVITEAGAREMPNAPRIVGGLALLFIGFALAFYAARKRTP